jgi:hypothetical protein
MFNTRVVSTGVMAASKTPPTAPKAKSRMSAVQVIAGSSSWSPLPSRCATAWVKARPSPSSKRLKYPIAAQASVSTPNRSAPRPRISGGIAITAATSGSICPSRFSAELRMSMRPVVTMRSSGCPDAAARAVEGCRQLRRHALSEFLR